MDQCSLDARSWNHPSHPVCVRRLDVIMHEAIHIEIRDGHLIFREGSPNGRVVREVATIRPSAQPVVKWAGGKQWLAEAAPLLAPSEWIGRYYEPFMGGGAFFFGLKPARATLSDCNKELIVTHREIRDDPEGLIGVLRSYEYGHDFYYQLRSTMPRSPRRTAARMLYLNRSCWNGLYRLNKQGIFNTPFGRFNNPTICDQERIRMAANRLGKARLCVGDFEKITKCANADDFVYFDPPYITGHQNNGFLKYNANLFSWSDQSRLAQVASWLAAGDVHVLVSNADHSAVIGLYKGFYLYRVTRHSLIGGDVSSRGTITEALLSSYPLLGCESEVV